MLELDEMALQRAFRTLEAAAPPIDRLSREHFVPSDTSTPSEPAMAASLVEAIATFTGSNAVLEELRWTRADVAAAVAEVRVRPGNPPPWGTGYIEFLAAVASEHVVALDGPPLTRPDRVFRAIGCAAASRIARTLDVECEPRACADLGRQLTRRLHACLTRAFDFELRVDLALRSLGRTSGATEPFDVTLDGWLRRAEMLPGTSYLIGLTWHRWQVATRELLGRVKLDWPMLRTHVGATEPAARVESVQCDAGDLHHGGRAVAILRVCGRAIVYKPRDGRASALFLALERAAADAKAIAPPYRRAIVCRGEYSWETFVAAAPCRSDAEVASFYRAIGGTLRLLELFEARDCWLDNLIAAGPHPVFIDLETILQGRPRPHGAGSGATRTAYDLLAESAALVGVTAAPTLIAPGHRAEDVAALTPRRRLRLPYRPALAGFQAAGMPAEGLDRDGFVELDPPPFAPLLDGRAVSVTEHLGVFLAGYRQVDTWLCHGASDVVARLEREHDIAQLPVRHLHGDTWSYSRALQATLSPELLSNGIAREIALWSLVLPDTHDVPTASRARIRIAEVAAIRELDIPFFTSRPGDTALRAGDEQIVDVFEQTALERLRRRAARDPFTVDERIAIVMSSMSCGRHRAGPAPTTRVRRHAIADARDVLDAACRIGNTIVKAAIPNGRAIAWHGLAYNPIHDVDVLTVLEPELATGTLGIAIALADLFAATSCDAFGATASAVLDAIAAPAFESATLGGFWGAPAIHFTRTRCAGALGTRLPPPVVLVDPVAAASASDPLDLLVGAAGTALACGATPSWWQAVVDAAHGDMACAAHDPRSARRLEALPRGAAARRLVEQRLGCDGARTSPAGSQSRGDIAALVTTRDPGAACMVQRLGRALPHAHRLRGDQLLDLMEIALAGRDVGIDEASEACSTLAAELCDRTTRGTWFPERLASARHDLSIIWGLGAVAHLLVRHARRSVPSVRLLGRQPAPIAALGLQATEAQRADATG